MKKNNLELFKQEIFKRLQIILGNNYEITDKAQKSILGVNSLRIMNLSCEVDIATTISMDDFFLYYQNGHNMDDIIQIIMNKIHSSELQINKIKYEDCSFNQVKDKIFYKLFNPDWNQEYLSNKFFLPYLDLVIVFYVVYPEGNILPIGYTLLKKWNFPDNLFEIARHNMHKNQEIKLIPIEKIIKKYIPSKELEHINPYMYITVDSSRWENSSNILIDTEILHEFSMKWDDNIVILPFTMQHFLVVPENKMPSYIDTQNLHINEEELFVGSKLSNHRYLYNKEKQKVELE